jgi:hypothetical protein
MKPRIHENLYHCLFPLRVSEFTAKCSGKHFHDRNIEEQVFIYINPQNTCHNEETNVAFACIVALPGNATYRTGKNGENRHPACPPSH